MINTTGSIRNVDAANAALVAGILATAQAAAPEAVPSASPVVHSLHVTPITSGGRDIVIQLQHAAGEVKRLVIQGTVTVEQLISHLCHLTGKREEAIVAEEIQPEQEIPHATAPGDEVHPVV